MLRPSVQVLDAYTPALRLASPSDTALLLVTVARLQHVSSYSWLQGVLDHCQDNMMTFDGQVCACACVWAGGGATRALHPASHLLLWLRSKNSKLRGSVVEDTSCSVLTALLLLCWLRPCGPPLLVCMDAPCVQELVTILSSLAQLHHQPDPEWMSIFFEAAEVHLPGLTGSQLAQMGYGLGQLGIEPPSRWMETFLTQVCGLGAASGLLVCGSACTCMLSWLGVFRCCVPTWVRLAWSSRSRCMGGDLLLVCAAAVTPCCCCCCSVKWQWQPTAWAAVTRPPCWLH